MVLLKRKLKRYRIPGVRFHEIIAVTEMGKDEAARPETNNDFLLGPKKRERRQIHKGHNKWAAV